VQYGEGNDPVNWITIATSSTPQEKRLTTADLDDSGDTTIHGNLATWDTGLTNYVYLPTHPKDHPINLKGLYTVRLVVTGKDGQTVEDRVTVRVANVIPNAWGGIATSKDARTVLTVPEQALMDTFRLISIEATNEAPADLPEGKRLVSEIYDVREPGERFTKDAELKIDIPSDQLGKANLDQVGIWGYSPKANQWQHLKSTRREGANSVLAKLKTLHSHYALMVSTAPGEGSTLETSRTGDRLAGFGKAAKSDDHFLVRNTFEQGLGEWSNRDGAVGGTVALDNSATADGTMVLRVTNTNKGGNFAVNVVSTPFDAREYPIVQFDYRIPADVKTNFLVKVSGRWYEIGFTDDKKELHDKRVNIAHIGDIPEVVADDRWRTAQLNLYDMLRTKTGNTLVEQMIMADWDVIGYMKLQFGSNAKGATYYIDNFTISRDASPGLRVAKDRVLVDDFDQKQTTNMLGEAAVVFTDSRQGNLVTNFSEADALGNGNALALSYDVSAAHSFAGYVSPLPSLDLRGYDALTFFVKGAADGQDLMVGLKDGSGHESKVRLGHYLPKGITTTWRMVRIPLVAFTGLANWGKVENLSLSFQHALAQTGGTIFVDDLAFQKGMKALLVDTFERGDGKNALGRNHRTLVGGAAAVNGTFARVDGNGIYRLSYGGNIGTIPVYASEVKSFAGWSSDLGGINCSACGTLSFRIRGAEGGENFSVYLDDGNFRWGVEVAKHAKVTASWQTVTIPLSEFSDYGVDLTHLAELQVIFEGVKMTGTIYLDDIQFGRKPDSGTAESDRYAASQ